MLKNILTLDGVSALSKQEQKSVHGGLAGSCAVRMLDGDGEISVVWGTKAEITAAGGNGGGNSWCCASCATASWINSCNIC